MQQSDFEAAITNSVTQSVLTAKNQQEAAAIALDILLTNAIMLTGVVERGCEGSKSIQRIVGRCERLNQFLREGKKKASMPTHTEGDPIPLEEQPKLVDFSVKGNSRIIKP
jgi:hypothetical protein